MATDTVRADYDVLGDVAGRFAQEADRIKQATQQLGRGTETLRRNNWIGQGAEAFYREMDSSVLPEFRRLEKALAEASRILKLISKVFQEGEQEGAGMVSGIKSEEGAGRGAETGEMAEGGTAGFGAYSGGAGGEAGASAGGGYGSGGGAGDVGGEFGAGGEYGSSAAGGGVTLENLPQTLENLLNEAVGGRLQPHGPKVLEIDIQLGKGAASMLGDTGMKYGIENPGGGMGDSGGGGAGAGMGAGTPTETPTEQPTQSGGGGGGGSDTGGGSPYSGGSDMKMGGAIGTPVGGGQPFWFGASLGAGMGAPMRAAVDSTVAAAQQGNALPSLLGQLGMTAGAAVVGVLGKVVFGKTTGPH